MTGPFFSVRGRLVEVMVSAAASSVRLRFVAVAAGSFVVVVDDFLVALFFGAAFVVALVGDVLVFLEAVASAARSSSARLRFVAVVFGGAFTVSTGALMGLAAAFLGAAAFLEGSFGAGLVVRGFVRAILSGALAAGLIAVDDVNCGGEWK